MVKNKNYVRAKKHLGQHFLNDESIAQDIVESLTRHNDYRNVLEIGPGMGVLTKFLLENDQLNTYVIDIDTESIAYLANNFPKLNDHIISGDYLKLDVRKQIGDNHAVIGNFPYNISSQIFFKILEDKAQVPEIVCMLQKEVAERLASPPGNKSYGILSVLLQAYYQIEYLFTVEPDKFNPPPKVRSGVIRLRRNEVQQLDCDEKLFKRVIKQGFQNRRKTLRNALKPLNLPDPIQEMELLNKRAEQLSVDDYIGLTQEITKWNK
jgi:16S rRNA (adenine1518-N6/adenine1519-N6)-dimethyltransferase